MTSDGTVVPLRQPDAVEDPLTAIPRSGARRLLAQAVEAEAEAFLAAMKGARPPDGRERLVRHGHAPERLVQTGVGTTGSDAEGSARWRCGGPSCATAALARVAASASASPRPSCRAGRG